MLKRIHSTFKKDDKKHPPPPFPLTRRATESDVGGSKPPLRRRPSIHNAQHRLRTLLGLQEPPPPLPQRELHITGPLEDPRLSRLDEWDDLRLAAWSVGDLAQRRELLDAGVPELPRRRVPRPMPPHRMHTF